MEVQARPQAPQCALSLCRSAQTGIPPVPGHCVWPIGQALVPEHMPPMQVWPIAQVRPHIPQLAASVMVLTQVLPQSVCPEGQDIIRQVPLMHT